MKQAILFTGKFFRWMLIFFLSVFHEGKSQISILNTGVNEYNITPKGLLEVSIMNTHSDMEVILEGKIFNAKNEIILDVLSNPFHIKQGLNNTSQLNINIASSTYAYNEQANYIKTSHALPSGNYKYCAIIKSYPNDIVTDEYCQDMESELSSFLFLVNPPDKEEIDTKYPILIWTHSEAFSNTNPNDYYKIIVTNLNEGQSPEAAINTNVPVYLKNYLNSHNIQYPIDAKELQWGQHYAWQVQKISNGNIVNKTEAWEFKLKAPPIIKENKYATVKKNMDGTYYNADGDKIFFRFDEGYGGKNINYRILNENRQLVSGEDMKGTKIEAVNTGYNQFVVNLKPYKLKSGMYTLEVINEKKEVYLLKFVTE